MNTEKGLRVAFLHGQCLDRSQWHSVIEGLTAAGMRYRMQAIDLLGHGEKRERSPKTFDDFVDDAIKEIGPTAASPVLLVGHSLGAWVAARWATAHPAGIAGLVLLAPALNTPPHFVEPFKALEQSLRTQGTQALLDFIDGAREIWFPPAWAAENADQIEAVLDVARAQDASAQADIMGVILDAPDCSADLEAFPRPVRIVRGTADPTASTVTVRPDDHVVLEDVGHFVNLERLGVVLETIQSCANLSITQTILEMAWLNGHPELVTQYRHEEYQRRDSNFEGEHDGEQFVRWAKETLSVNGRFTKLTLKQVDARPQKVSLGFELAHPTFEDLNIVATAEFHEGLCWRSENTYAIPSGWTPVTP
ncbi:MAG: alpha/beta hydrolase [Myxococcota bacterium]